MDEGEEMQALHRTEEDERNGKKKKAKAPALKKQKIRIDPQSFDASESVILVDSDTTSIINSPMAPVYPFMASPSGFFEVIANNAKSEGKFDPNQLAQVLSAPAPSKAKEPEKSCSISFYFEDEIINALQFEDLKDPAIVQKMDKQTFWLDVVGYDPVVIRSLSQIFGLHPLTVEDILNDESREKCELFEEYSFVCIRALVGYGDESFISEVLYIVCCEKFLVSFHMNEISSFKDIQQRLSRLNHIKLSPGWILYAILDNIVDTCLPVADMLEMEANTINELVFIFSESDQNDMLRRIAKARKQLTHIQKLVSNKVNIFKQLRTREQKFQRALFSEEVSLYLEDVNTHAVAADRLLTANQEVLSRGHESYLAKIGVELTVSANRLGTTSKKFASGACIFLPLNLIAGTMGMNVKVPGNLDSEEDREYWFYVLLGLMILISGGMILYGRRHNWFS